MSSSNPIKPSDLRGILEYVPMFRGQTFVVGIDGAMIASDALENVLLDIAVLRNLNIRVVLVHGIGYQIRTLGETEGIDVDFPGGDGPVDGVTLDLALRSNAAVGNRLAGALSATGMTYAFTNAVRSTEVGILRGSDQMNAGKVDRVDTGLFERLLGEDVLPVVSPISHARDGRPLRVNSDPLAAYLAVSLRASKLIFLTEYPGLAIDGVPVLNMPLSGLRERLEKHPGTIDSRLAGKARATLEALTHGVARAHILDGRISGGLLTEIFDKVGLGTMIHSNEYQQIRTARRSDARGIFNMSRHAARVEAIRPRSIEDIEASIDRFFVYEVDDGLIGCAMLQPYPERAAVEIGAVYVQSYYEGRGVGRKMIEYAIERSRDEDFDYLFALSTQSFSYFTKVCGFDEGGLDDLPESRKQTYLREGRGSRILIKFLKRD